jgi:hypothetical protein
VNSRTAKQHNAPQIGESELRQTPVQVFESMMEALGYKFVTVPSPTFTDEVMRRIKNATKKRKTPSCKKVG